MNLLILGGNSDIGFAVASKFAQKGRANIILASRDMEALKKKGHHRRINFICPSNPLHHSVVKCVQPFVSFSIPVRPNAINIS